MFQKESFRKNIKPNHENWLEIRDEKQQFDIDREATKMSTLSLGKIGKYPTGEEILLSDQRRIIEQAEFINSLLGRVLEKQTKIIDNQGEKQIKAIKGKVEQQLLDTDKKTNHLVFFKIWYSWRTSEIKSDQIDNFEESSKSKIQYKRNKNEWLLIMQ